MSKEVRFSQLVKASGKPETLTLWSQPEKNPTFNKARKENRILTVIQRHKGAKDFGLIGFHPQPMATYLVFSRKLPESFDDARVIGINYDLLEASVVNRKDAWRPPKKKKQVQPVKKEFRIVVQRVATNEVSLTVAAETRRAAAEEALKSVKGESFGSERTQVENSIKSIRAM